MTSAQTCIPDCGMDPTEDECEFYETPAWCTRLLLEHCYLPGGLWLEPSVGDGAIVDAVNSVRPDVVWATIDIRPTKAAQVVGDFREVARLGFCQTFAVGITNPPFSLALDFVQAMMKCCDVVVILQRLNWLASGQRNAWLRDHTPDVYVLGNRPSFVGGGTDMTDYAWMVWWTRDYGVHPRLTILPALSDRERAR